MDEERDLKKRQIQIRRQKNSTKIKDDWKVSQEAVSTLSTLPAEIAAQAQQTAAQAQETGGPRCRSSFSENNEEIKRVSAALVSHSGSSQQQLVAKHQSNTRLQNQLTFELLYNHEAMPANHRELTRGAQELSRTHSKGIRQLRIEYLQQRLYSPFAGLATAS